MLREIHKSASSIQHMLLLKCQYNKDYAVQAAMLGTGDILSKNNKSDEHNILWKGEKLLQ